MSTPPQFYSDPAIVVENNDGGPFIITDTKPSVDPAHRGRPIPDTVVGTVVRMARITLTQAQLFALTTTPVQVLPMRRFTASGTLGMPGPGLAYSVKSLSARLNFGTVAYTGGTLVLYLGPPVNAHPLTGALGAVVTQTVTSSMVDVPILQVGPLAQAQVENQPVVLGGTNFTAGDGTVDVIVEYTVVQM